MAATRSRGRCGPPAHREAWAPPAGPRALSRPMPFHRRDGAPRAGGGVAGRGLRRDVRGELPEELAPGLSATAGSGSQAASVAPATPAEPVEVAPARAEPGRRQGRPHRRCLPPVEPAEPLEAPASKVLSGAGTAGSQRSRPPPGARSEAGPPPGSRGSRSRRGAGEPVAARRCLAPSPPAERPRRRSHASKMSGTVASPARQPRRPRSRRRCRRRQRTGARLLETGESGMEAPPARRPPPRPGPRERHAATVRSTIADQSATPRPARPVIRRARLRRCRKPRPRGVSPGRSRRRAVRPGAEPPARRPARPRNPPRRARPRPPARPAGEPPDDRAPDRNDRPASAARRRGAAGAGGHRVQGTGSAPAGRARAHARVGRRPRCDHAARRARSSSPRSTSHHRSRPRLQARGAGPRRRAAPCPRVVLPRRRAGAAAATGQRPLQSRCSPRWRPRHRTRCRSRRRRPWTRRPSSRRGRSGSSPASDLPKAEASASAPPAGTALARVPPVEARGRRPPPTGAPRRPPSRHVDAAPGRPGAGRTGGHHRAGDRNQPRVGSRRLVPRRSRRAAGPRPGARPSGGAGPAGARAGGTSPDAPARRAGAAALGRRTPALPRHPRRVRRLPHRRPALAGGGGPGRPGRGGLRPRGRHGGGHRARGGAAPLGAPPRRGADPPPARPRGDRVPVAFNTVQRERLREAAERAGFEGVRLVQAPTAATMAFARGRGLARRRILVFRMGASTCDIAVLAASGDDLDMVACAGDASLGSANFDEQIALALDKTARSDGAVLRRRIGEAAQLRSQLEDATVEGRDRRRDTAHPRRAGGTHHDAGGARCAARPRGAPLGVADARVARRAGAGGRRAPVSPTSGG